MNQLANRALFVASITAISATVYAAITLPHSFSPNTTAKSSEVNANFTALLNEVNALRAELDEINEVMEIKVVGTKKTVVFKDTNVNISSSEDGLGNLIMGSEASVGTSPSVCSEEDAYLVNNGSNPQTYCNGSSYDIYGTWAAEQKTGKHNIIMGKGNSYVGEYGLIVGNKNAVIGNYGVVFGFNNTSAGSFATVTGGSKNVSAGPYSSISGGEENKAISKNSSVSGGKSNRAGSVTVSTDLDEIDYSGDFTSVSGGRSNLATGEGAVTIGGRGNLATGTNSVTIAGFSSKATGTNAGTLGGQYAEASGTNSATVSGYRAKAKASYSAVIGGGTTLSRRKKDNTTGVTGSVIIGGFNNVTGSRDADGNATGTGNSRNGVVVSGSGQTHDTSNNALVSP